MVVLPNIFILGFVEVDDGVAKNYWFKRKRWHCENSLVEEEALCRDCARRNEGIWLLLAEPLDLERVIHKSKRAVDTLQAAINSVGIRLSNGTVHLGTIHHITVHPTSNDTVQPPSTDTVHPPSIDTVHPPSMDTVHPPSIDIVHPNTVHHDVVHRGTIHLDTVHPDTVHPVKKTPLAWRQKRSKCSTRSDGIAA